MRPCLLGGVLMPVHTRKVITNVADFSGMPLLSINPMMLRSMKMSQKIALAADTSWHFWGLVGLEIKS